MTSPPQPFPTLQQAKKIKAPTLGAGEWPCVHCFGTGCGKCNKTGLGPRSAFAKWYLKKLKAHNEAVERYGEDLNKLRQVTL